LSAAPLPPLEELLLLLFIRQPLPRMSQNTVQTVFPVVFVGAYSRLFFFRNHECWELRCKRRFVGCKCGCWAEARVPKAGRVNAVD
jgi:hypothetical protein